MPPANDYIDDAIVISGDSTTAVSTVGAALGGSGNPIDDDFPYLNVWYRLEPSQDRLLGIATNQTGGAATDGPEVDIYTLVVGEDPPDDWLDLDQPYDYHGDGTATPVARWESGPTTYFPIKAGRVYYLDCTNYGYDAEIEFDMVLNTIDPLPNDDWEEAIVFNTPGGNVHSGTTVNATMEPDEVTSGGSIGPSVWYRIEAQADGIIQLSFLHLSDYLVEAGWRLRAVVYGPVDPDPPADIIALQAEAVVKTFHDNGPLTSQAPYRTTTGNEPWYGEWMANSGDVFYVRVSHASQFGDPQEGTFDIRCTIPDWTEVNADDLANLDSSTVSIVDTDWVHEEQYRGPDHDHDTYKGDLDYVETFSITPGLTGDYAVELYVRCTEATGGDFVVNMRRNGQPVRVEMWWELFDDAERWVPLTHDYSIQDVGAGQLGTVFVRDTNPLGPRHVHLAAGDILSFALGNIDQEEAAPPAEFIEIQKVRFSPAGAYDPLSTGWKAMQTEIESWTFNEFSGGVPGVALGSELFLMNSVDPRIFGDTAGGAGRREFGKLGVWRYELVNGAMTAPDGDLNLGASGGDLHDLRVNQDSTTHFPYFWDLTVLPNGDIYCIWTEWENNYPSMNITFAMAMWDGASWTQISDDCIGLGAAFTGHTIWHLSLDNDGTDVFFTYGRNKTSGNFTTTAGNGYRWHCWKYDVSGDSFSELGSGQTAYPGATLGQHAGDFDYPPRMKVSPAGVPWVIWSEFDPDVGLQAEDYFWVYYWDGSDWVDAEIPHPGVAPPDVGGSTYEVGSPGDEKGNYINFLTIESFSYDLEFCHHDGPSETPAVIHQFVWADQAAGSAGDTSGLFYAECNDVGDWQNEKFFIPGVDWGSTYGLANPRLTHVTDQYSGNLYLPWLGGWDQGLRLDTYNGRPILYTQAGFFFGGADAVVVLHLNAAGDTFEMLGPGLPTDAVHPDPFGYAWSDFSQPGCTVNGVPVTWWSSPWNFGDGYWIATFSPSGGNVSMNWRSSDRRGAANRVLLG